MVFEENPELNGRIPASSGNRLKTNTFSRMAEVCLRTEPEDADPYLVVLGRSNRQREQRWILRKYLEIPDVADKYKVVLAAADGAAVKSGRIVGMPTVVPPGVGLTQTFLAVGKFETEQEADACAAYIKTKFVRALVGLLKTTRNNSAIKWIYVPLQNFTDTSDIDWTRPVSEIDQQLYAKYKLNNDEIEYVESHVMPME